MARLRRRAAAWFALFAALPAIAAIAATVTATATMAAPPVAPPPVQAPVPQQAQQAQQLLQPLQPLQPLIDAATPGATLRLAPGRYQGPAIIRRPLTLDGGGAAQIVGDGRGTVLSVRADGVTLRALRITGSGDSQDRIDAAVWLQGSAHTVEQLDIDDALFGLHLQGVSGSVVRASRVRGKALPPGLRGDALRLWNSRHNRIEDNVFTRGRDITLINSPDNALSRNRFDDGRYGLHAVFSPRLHAEGNRLERTGTGIVVLYSPQLTLRGNHVAHALTDGGAGIVIKESDDATVVGNEVLHCAVGMKLDTPVQGRGRLLVRGNRFAHNIVGLFFYGEAGSGRFEDNRFEHNLTTVAISAAGAGSAHRWSGNQWDEYQGLDLDRDRVGDTAHEVLLFADRIWMEQPMTTFFRNSPALELLDFLERLAPFSAPVRVLLDPRPRMPGTTWNKESLP
ncbi:MAG: nitrous oxide reductase family maturation protein NosD [Burkholderiales bacterium]|nr:nitrous oxide reductase family maturation protein NosD [Burkholderiales bacterium]